MLAKKIDRSIIYVDMNKYSYVGGEYGRYI